MKERPKVSFFNACNSGLEMVKNEKRTLLSPLQMTELELEDEENLID